MRRAGSTLGEVSHTLTDALHEASGGRYTFGFFAGPADGFILLARMERIKEQGGDPFKEYSLPEAILKFRQGVGRLIRTGTDEGIVAILDSRIVSKWYGRLFLSAIPECPVDVVEVGADPNVVGYRSADNL